MLKTTITAAAIALGVVQPAAAQTAPSLSQLNPEVSKAVITDLGEEFAQCSAYYNFFAQITTRDWPNVDVSTSEKAGDFARQIAVGLVGVDVTMANYKLTLESIISDTGGDSTKLSIVIAKHAYPCKDLIEHPEHKLAHWIEVEKAGATSASTAKK